MRRFLIWVGVLVGAFLLVVLGIGVFLMIAPGSEVFGIKYVKATSSTNVEVTKRYTEAVTGGLVFDTVGVPVTIEYHPYSSFEFEFVQKFNGFTRTKVDKPSISVDVDKENGNLVIKTQEFTKFLWGSNSAGYSLKCKIPSNYRNHSVTFSSDRSSLSFTSNQDVVADVDRLVVATKGAVSFSGKINISNLTVNSTNYKITVPASVNLANANFACKNKGVKIESSVAGKIEFQSKNGSLDFLDAGSLEATTKGGSVKSTSTGLSVKQDANITTGNKGKVVLQGVGGNLQVTTKSGSVEIGQNLSGTNAGVVGKVNIITKSGAVHLKGNYSPDLLVNIKTSTGKIFVGDNNRGDAEKEQGALANIKNLEIETKSGAITIEEVSSVKITATKAKVTIGKFISSASITTTSGKVYVGGNGLGGTLNVKTGKNGNVTATNLGGATTIDAGGKIDVRFTNVLEKIDIKGTSKDIKVIVPDGVTKDNKYIVVESQKTSAYIKITGLEYSGKVYHSAENIPAEEEHKLIKITSTSGKIRLASVSFE